MNEAVDELFEHRVRQATFDFLSEAQRTFGDVLTAKTLQRGIELEGRRIPVFDLYRGIHKPSVLDAACRS